MNFDEKSRLYSDRGVGRSFPVTTALEKAMLIIIAVAMTVTVGLIICLVSINKTNNECRRELKIEHEHTCVTPACVNEASSLLKSMDLSVDPCTDFYSFVCGNWIKEHHLVSSIETQFTQLSSTVFLRIRDILKDLEKKKDLPENKQKTSDFFKYCMDDVHRNIMDAEELLSDLKKFGGWPIIVKDWNKDFDWSELMIQLFKNGYLNNMLFTLRVDIDEKNTSRSLITVTDPSLGLGRKEYYILPYEKTLNHYKNVILKLAKLLNPDIDENESKKDIEEAFKIEDRLAHLSKDEKTAFKEHQYTNSLEKLEISTPKIPWRKLLQGLLPPGTDLPKEQPIGFTSPSLLEGLDRLLNKLDNSNGKRTLANYMFYRVVINAAKHLSKKFYSLVWNLGLEPSKPSLPWEICTKVTMELFPFPLTSSYVTKYMTNGTKEQLKMMIEDLRNSQLQAIRNSKWLDEETKNYALLKAKKMKAAIAYEEEMMDDDNLDSYYKDVNITENHFGNVKHMISFRLRQSMEGLHEKRVRLRWTDIDNLLSANAFYRPNENSIIIPVGVLQDAVFEIGRPNYINYGSLGMVVGHELTHAFDTVGSLYDSEGSDRMWWSEKSWKKFEEKTKCYEEQYNSYYVPEYNTSINGTLTLGENIADNGGLKTAYYAYKALLKRIGSEKSLPGLPYNEKQMFWIAFASVWCRKQTDDSTRYTLKHSVHTLSKFRVLGTLSNSKEFSEDFKCESNSTLNPASRCYLWE